jgi:hypothetical protein
VIISSGTVFQITILSLCSPFSSSIRHPFDKVVRSELFRATDHVLTETDHESDFFNAMTVGDQRLTRSSLLG